MAKVVKENGLTYRILKRQILNDITNEETDWEERYPYRLNMINTFDGRSITHEEAEECRTLIAPYAPVEEKPEVPVEQEQESEVTEEPTKTDDPQSEEVTED